MERTTNLLDEELMTLKEASEDFGGVKVPMPTVIRWVQTGIKGLKLETVMINKRYTSRAAIRRFIERKQGFDEIVMKPKVKRMTRSEVQEGLRRHGIIK